MINLKHLEETEKMLYRGIGSFRRRSGKTYYACFNIANLLKFNEGLTIPVYVSDFHRIKFFIQTLSEVLAEVGLEMGEEIRNFTYSVKENTNTIKFFTPTNIDRGGRGRTRPVIDIEEKDSEWWRSTIGLNSHDLGLALQNEVYPAIVFKTEWVNVK